MRYQEIEGNLITLALEGMFDVIAHGCNCQCKMGAGLAPQMAEAFGCDEFEMENSQYKADINKLGTIDYEEFAWQRHTNKWLRNWKYILGITDNKRLFVVNAYTQFMYGTNHADGVSKPLDYEALTLCLRKMNHIFKGKHIGLPYVIGCGLAGGNIKTVINIIKKELCNMDVTMVKFKK